MVIVLRMVRLLRVMVVDFNLNIKSWEFLSKPFLIKACWDWFWESAQLTNLKGPEATVLQTALGIEIKWSGNTEQSGCILKNWLGEGTQRTIRKLCQQSLDLEGHIDQDPLWDSIDMFFFLFSWDFAYRGKVLMNITSSHEFLEDSSSEILDILGERQRTYVELVQCRWGQGKEEELNQACKNISWKVHGD